MFRFCRLPLAIAFCCLTIGASPTRVEANEPGALRRGWGRFWGHVESLETSWKDCCRNCTLRWYGPQTQPDYGLQMLEDTTLPQASSSLVVFVHGYN